MDKELFLKFNKMVLDFKKNYKKYYVISVWDEDEIDKCIFAEGSLFILNSKIEVIKEELKTYLGNHKTIANKYDKIIVEGKEYNIFIEEYKRPFTLLILGAGHIAMSLVKFADILGYRTIVVDDREDFANKERLPQATEVTAIGFEEYLKKFEYDNNSGVVVITRGHSYDAVCLKEIIDKELAYIGMIGSKRRVSVVLDKMRKNGVSEENIERVNSPIGLPIGGDSPEEIALSIISEINCILKKGPEQLKKLRNI